MSCRGLPGLRVGIAGFVWLGAVFLAFVAVIATAVGTSIEFTAGATIEQYARVAAQEELQETRQGETTAALWTTRREQAQTWQGWATVAAIALGGVWAVWVFVLGRSFSGTIEIRAESQRILEHAGKKGAVILVRVKNVGRSKVKNEGVYIEVVPMLEDQLEARLSRMTVVPASLDPSASKMPLPPGFARRRRALFQGEIRNLEPGEEAVEEVLLSFGDYRITKVEVTFFGRIFPIMFGWYLRGRAWSSRIILDALPTEEN